MERKWSSLSRCLILLIFTVSLYDEGTALKSTEDLMAGFSKTQNWLFLLGRKISTIGNTKTQKYDADKLQPAKQTVFLDWKISEWSECSATCGGGFRARSVRCLDECGIISPQNQRCNASKISRPPTHEFCAQIDCTTGILNDDILPSAGLTESPIPNGSQSVIDFTFSSVDRYQINQNITETDGTLTILMETVRNGMTTFTCQIRPLDIAATLGQAQGKKAVFLNNDFLFELDCIVTTIIPTGEMVIYADSNVTILGRDTEFSNITTFWYCDGFRCYKFNSSKSSFVQSGPTGKLFTSKDVALYSISGLINSNIEDILEKTPTTTLPTPETSSIAVSSVVPTPTQSTLLLSTIKTRTASISFTTEHTTLALTITPTMVEGITTVVPTPTTISVTTFSVSETAVATPTPTVDPDTTGKELRLCLRRPKSKIGTRNTKPHRKQSRTRSTKTEITRTTDTVDVTGITDKGTSGKSGRYQHTKGRRVTGTRSRGPKTTRKMGTMDSTISRTRGRKRSSTKNKIGTRRITTQSEKLVTKHDKLRSLTRSRSDNRASEATFLHKPDSNCRQVPLELNMSYDLQGLLLCEPDEEQGCFICCIPFGKLDTYH